MFLTGLAVIGVAFVGLAIARFMDRAEQRNVSSSTDSYNSDPSVQRKRREFVARRFAKCDQESLSEAEVVGTTQYVRT